MLSLLVLSSLPELGKVDWIRDLDAGIARARAEKKPIFLLFTEVPGCSTVKGFGEGALSDPQLVPLIQRAMVPVAIFNNIGGRDRRVLESFDEPAWNNPVVRIVDADLKPLAPRFAGPYTAEALEKLLATTTPPKTARMTMSGACFWACEAALGQIEGVVYAQVGFLNGEEVVEVEHDPAVIDRAALLKAARARSCVRHVFARTASEHAIDRAIAGEDALLTTEALRPSPSDELYYLARSKYRDLPLDRTTKLRVNAALADGRDPSPLFPR